MTHRTQAPLLVSTLVWALVCLVLCYPSTMRRRSPNSDLAYGALLGLALVAGTAYLLRDAPQLERGKNQPGLGGKGTKAVAAPPSGILLIGDSHSAASYGLGPQLAARLAARGQQLSWLAHNGWGVSLYNKMGTSSNGVVGQPGSSTITPRRRANGRYADTLRQVVAAARPAAVVVALGGNDAWGYGSPNQAEAYAAELRRLIGEIRAAGVAHIVWVGPTRAEAGSSVSHPHLFQPKREAVAQLQQRVLAELGVPWFDSMAATAHNPTSDGVHYNASGYASWADAADTWLQQQGL